MTKAKALEVDPAELRPNPWNTNIVSPDSEMRLENSVDRFGIFKPIVVREVEGVPGYEIIGGEHRWLAAKHKKLKKVPIWNLGLLDDKKAKEISVADNSRYGVDDTLAFSELLKDIGDESELQSYLPFTDVDLHSIFSASDIALDELDLPEEETKPAISEEEAPTTRVPKTHTMMRFKVANEDAERIAELIARTQREQGFTTEDQATNAGDALVHLLLRSSEDEE